MYFLHPNLANREKRSSITEFNRSIFASSFQTCLPIQTQDAYANAAAHRVSVVVVVVVVVAVVAVVVVAVVVVAVVVVVVAAFDCVCTRCCRFTCISCVYFLLFNHLIVVFETTPHLLCIHACCC